jgi:hypothetical protein
MLLPKVFMRIGCEMSKQLDKAKQKNFIYSVAVTLAAGSPNGTAQRRKSFLVLFFKKEPLSFILP